MIGRSKTTVSSPCATGGLSTIFLALIDQKAQSVVEILVRTSRLTQWSLNLNITVGKTLIVGILWI